MSPRGGGSGHKAARPKKAIKKKPKKLKKKATKK
jgi:hypothetical protein